MTCATGSTEQAAPLDYAPLLGGGPGDVIADLSNTRALEVFLDETTAVALERDHIAGGALAIVQNGRVLFTKGYGFADLEAQRPVDPDTTLFRVGSLAKLFVGTAVMQLVEQGVLDLDVDVNRYLETFQLPESFDEPVTLRHLLTHTAGFEERIIGEDRSDRPPGDVRPLDESLLNTIPARVRPPGEIASYSNWGVSLAGYIVESVSGLSFADYVDQHILAPLGMTRSTFLEPVPAPLAEDLAVGYVYENDTFEPHDFEFMGESAPAGALSSTAIDMTRFMITHLQRGRLESARILTEESADQMHRRQFGSHPDMPGIGLSFGVSTLQGRHLLQHSGATMVFHANLVLLPRENVGLFLAFNGPGDADGYVMEAFLNRYFPAAERQAAEPPEHFAARSARYVGTYRSNRLAFTRLEKVTRMRELTVHDTGRGTLFLGDLLSDPDNPDEGMEFVPVGPDLFWNEEQDALMAFSEDTSGDITNLFIGSAIPSFYRVAWYETMHALGLILAVSFVVFAVAGARQVWVLARRIRHPVAEPGWAAATRGTLLGLSVTGAVFVAGFTTMILTIDDYFRYPLGTEAMLLLPVLTGILTVVAGGFVLFSWVQRYGPSWARIGNTAVIITSLAFLAFLHLWNVLGWRL